jgi:hypothetical protein
MSDPQTAGEPRAPDPFVMDALKEAWGHGYQQAVDALREMTDEFGDEQARVLIGTLADMLEGMKP